MRFTRREILRASAAGAVLAGMGDLSRLAGRAAALPLSTGTTLDQTILRGATINSGGYRRLVGGPAEPFVVREEVGGHALAGREARRRSVLSLVQFTDSHIIDGQSPARVEFLDRYNDGVGSPLVFSAAYRPQEMLTAQVTDALVRAVNAVGAGPGTGRPFDLAISTGDTVDNCQLNELRWLIDVLDGQPVRPDSGDRTRWEGVHDGDSLTYDRHYWHPGGAPPGKQLDIAHSRYGFPTVPGLLDAARRAFQPEGLRTPWLAAYGNHDGLVQGNFPNSFHLGEVATGPLKVVSLPAGVSPEDIASGSPAALAALTEGPARVVTADPRRRVISRQETVEEYFKTAGTPRGHGFTAENRSQGTAYYHFDVGRRVRGIVLDTVNPNGEADGSIDEDQLAWLEAHLLESSRRYLGTDGSVIDNPAGVDRLIVLFSHHTLGTMINPIVSVDSPGRRVLGDEVKALLLRYPNVVLWVNGHTHVNAVIPHARTAGSAAPGGFWEVNTASHVDFPQQARIVELANNRDGTLSVFGTIVDAAASLVPPGNPSKPAGLASLSRELAANDWQERPATQGVAGDPDGRRGTVEDRNVELIVPAPF
jgi:metallophosphoesterase (TIGR03767 family)